MVYIHRLTHTLKTSKTVNVILFFKLYLKTQDDWAIQFYCNTTLQ